MKKNLKQYPGIWTALVTPFNPQGAIDYDAFKKLIQFQIKGKVTGLIPCGTTGEAPTLSEDEKKELILFTLKMVKGTPVRVFAGTGSNDTKQTVAFSQWASRQKVHGLLVVTPYYNKPTPLGLETHFTAVANAVDCDVMLYNVPGRTGVSFTPESICKLAAHPQITALKEATGNPPFTSEVVERLRREKRELAILSGDDATFLPLLSVGACGVVSVASNLIPRQMRDLFLAFQKGDWKWALELHNTYYPIFRDLFIEANPGPIKAALHQCGVMDQHPRLPLVLMSKSNLEKLKQSLLACKIPTGALPK